MHAWRRMCLYFVLRVVSEFSRPVVFVSLCARTCAHVVMVVCVRVCCSLPLMSCWHPGGRSLLKKQVSGSDWVSQFNTVSIQPAHADKPIHAHPCTRTHTHSRACSSDKVGQCSCHSLSEWHLFFSASAASVYEIAE